MDSSRQGQEVDRNYEAFQRILPSILDDHRDQYALMREGKIIAFFDRPGAANVNGMSQFPDRIFSIQEVTDEPIDLGFFSHVSF